MKKRLAIFGVIFLLSSLAAAAMADSPVKLVVDGKEISTDVPIQIVNGRTIVPVRAIAEAFGAAVEWDRDTNTVIITNREKQNFERRVDLLESALLPQTPEEAADAWARGVKSRNGALQYAVMSPDLQKNDLSDYENLNWVTGTSSPWVDNYEILRKEKQADDSYVFEIKFNMMSSTGSEGTSTTRIIVGRATGEQEPLPVYPGDEGKWTVKQIIQPD